MIARRSRTWLVAAPCLAVLLGAVGWISVTVIRLDRSERTMQQQAAVEENVRLALWRMDSALAPILAREGLRPVAEYNRQFAPAEYVRLYFQLDGKNWMTGQDSSPLAELRQHITGQRLVAALEDSQPSVSARSIVTVAIDDGAMTRRESQDRPPPQQAIQMQRSSAEWDMRQQSIANAYQQNAQSTDLAGNPNSRNQWTGDNPGNPGTENMLAMTPLWVDGELFLLRQVAGRSKNQLMIVQGCWMDWPKMQSWLRGSISDLLPGARLDPAPHPGQDARPDTTGGASGSGMASMVDHTRSLAALPVSLEPGTVPYTDPVDSPVVPILVLVWCAVLVAAVAVVALVMAISALSERRAAFVAAVTHELRTPLTTLQTYSEMLVDGKIGDPAKQAQYLTTLHREALRLGHLVDNVLSYSRIERGAGGVRRDVVDARALLSRITPRLDERTSTARMQLAIELPAGHEPLDLCGDESAIEHILFNLIDNACKYAAQASDPRVVVSVQTTAQNVAIQVRDHGPGIPADVQRSLFKPFSKSVERAAVSAPGVGLGLSLSRRLARAMGGDLRVDRTVSSGTCMVLGLRARPAQRSRQRAGQRHGQAEPESPG